MQKYTSMSDTDHEHEINRKNSKLGFYFAGTSLGTVATLVLLIYLIIQTIYNPFTDSAWMTANLVVLAITGFLILIPVLIVLGMIGVILVMLCVSISIACTVAPLVIAQRNSSVEEV